VSNPTSWQDTLTPGVLTESNYINKGKGKRIVDGNTPYSPAPFNDMNPCTHRKMLFFGFNDSVVFAMSSRTQRKLEEHAFMREREVKLCFLVYHHSSDYQIMPPPLTTSLVLQSDHPIHISPREWKGKLNHVPK